MNSINRILDIAASGIALVALVVIATSPSARQSLDSIGNIYNSTLRSIIAAGGGR